MNKRHGLNRATGLFLATALFLVSFSGLPAGAVSNALTTEADSRLELNKDWVREDGGFQFPESIRHEQGYLIGTQEEIWAATQIPDAILKTVSTGELISLILEYPLMPNLHAYQTVAEGYQNLKPGFNGFSELLSREDAFPKLIEAYENYAIPSEKIMDWDSLDEETFVDEFNKLIRDKEVVPLILADSAVYTSINILEMLIHDVITNADSSARGMYIFAESYVDKLEEKFDSAYYDDVNAADFLVYLTEAEEDNALLTRVMEKVLITSAVSAAKAAPVTRAGVVIPMPTEPISNYPYPVTSYQVYTPSYRTAYVTLNTNIEMFPASQYASMIAQHQGAYLVSTASKTFNCHSYAWLSRHYPGAANDRFTNYQHMWLNSTSTFATDPFYVKLSSVISGAIADWSGHSGIITQTNIGYNNGIIDHMMISKWGPGPMVIHRVSDNPYYDRGDSVSYYTW